MIGGDKVKDICVAEVLKNITDYDIFRYYMPHDNWQIGKATYSPFRNEKTGSFIISQHNNRLSFYDFGDSSKKGDCFKFVELLFNVPHYKALAIIDRDFGIGIFPENRTKKYTKIITTYDEPEIVEKKYSFIQVKTRKFNHDELAYWNMFHQDLQDLKDNHIYAIDKVYLNKKIMYKDNGDLRFGYLYEDRWKIYSPYSSKEFKWVPNNVPITAMDGKQNLSIEHPVFINKSKKDYMVIKKLYPYSCAVQNEGASCFSKENVEFLKSNSSSQILSFDSDDTGVKNSKAITKEHDFKYCNVHRVYLKEGLKDWSDLAKKYGMIVVEHYLKQKGIIE